jgi:DNA-binding MarR family transcriptional regulator
MGPPMHLTGGPDAATLLQPLHGSRSFRLLVAATATDAGQYPFPLGHRALTLAACPRTRSDHSLRPTTPRRCDAKTMIDVRRLSAIARRQDGATGRRPAQAATPPSSKHLQARSPASGDAPAGQHRSVSLDGFLELVHLEHLSPLDLRVLLRVTHREATPRELADSMGHPPTLLRRASARLVARGLLRRRRRRSRHDRLEVTLATTASGMGALWRAAQALGIDPSASPTPPVAPDWPATSSKAIGDTTGRPAAAAPPRIDTEARTG